MNTLGGRGRLGYKTKGRCPRRRTRLLKPWLGEPILKLDKSLSILCLVSLRASSLASANVRNVDFDKIGRSGRDGYMLTHHFDHSRLGTISYPR